MNNSYCIYVVSPPGYIHSAAFNEVAEGLVAAFHDLGYDVPIIREPIINMSGIPIILGATLLEKAPKEAIIYNLEQVTPGSPWLKDSYVNLLKSHTVWDYSNRNISELSKIGIIAKHLGIGYNGILTRIKPVEKDIDVLFVGSVNDRRRDIINTLHNKGVKVASAFGIYGAERDALLARAKIILNIHYYESKLFEIVRCSYLLANRMCIVSEDGPDTEYEKLYAEAIHFTPYSGIIDKCLQLLSMPNAMDYTAQRGFDIFSKQLQTDLLKAVL